MITSSLPRNLLRLFCHWKLVTVKKLSSNSSLMLSFAWPPYHYPKKQEEFKCCFKGSNFFSKFLPSPKNQNFVRINQNVETLTRV